MSIAVEPEASVSLGVRQLPGESSQDHAHEDHGDGPYVGQPRIVVIPAEDLGRKIWI